MATESSKKIAELFSEARRARDACYDVGGWPGLAAAVLATARLDQELLNLSDDTYCYARWRSGGREYNTKRVRRAVQKDLEEFVNGRTCELLCMAAGADVEAYRAAMRRKSST